VKPVLAGRLWWGVGMLVGLGIIANPKFNGWVMSNFAPPEDLHTDVRKWREGATTNVRITVITADAARLGCAHDGTFDGVHCGFKENHTPWPRDPGEPVDDNNPNLVQPYRTSPDNVLVLISGVWAKPEVAMRLHREPPSGVAVKRLQRFDITCSVKFLKKLDKVELHWEPTGNWQTEHGAWVARAETCTVNNG
jgi:hypothetical protein